LGHGHSSWSVYGEDFAPLAAAETEWFSPCKLYPGCGKKRNNVQSWLITITCPFLLFSKVREDEKAVHLEYQNTGARWNREVWI